MSEVFNPQVNVSKEFFQIAHDFGEPLEIVREALSNAFDSGASTFYFSVGLDLADNLIIEMRDDGEGMDFDKLKNNFWDLGNSSSEGDASKIGEKGHGTKIYLRSDRVYVETSKGKKTFSAECLHPLETLTAGKVHSVEIKEIPRNENTLPTVPGTFIRIEGYNNNDTSIFSEEKIEDYSYWFTKLGSFENQFPSKIVPGISMKLKALGKADYHEMAFGHRFPKENHDIKKLRDDHGQDAADWFVKKYIYENQTLEKHPHVSFDMVAYVEGDAAKRSCNKMLGQRKMSASGRYKVSDRYGIWLSKDFIPVKRANEWVKSFGTGSNSVLMLHGFVNCQQFRLTANRGDVSNTNPDLIDDLKERVGKILAEINEDAYRNNGLKELAEQNEAEKVDSLERHSYEDRIARVKARKHYDCGDGLLLYEPSNESELYGMFVTYFTMHKDDFEFEPVDYMTSAGLDVLARSKAGTNPADTDYWYVELKKTFRKVEFNHSFGNIRYIVCWDMDPNVKDGDEFTSKLKEKRKLKVYPQKDGESIYKLEDPSGQSQTSIKVVFLKDIIEKRSSPHSASKTANAKDASK